MSRAWSIPPIRLRLFGAFHLECDTQTIHLITRKAEALLAYLVLHPEPHAREKLAALLWGDFPDDQARASLRNALASIRKCLGNEIIYIARDAVQFNPHPSLWVDVSTFQKIIEANTCTRPTRTDIEKWQTAADLYRGDLLANCYDDWLIAPRERFRTMYVDLLLQLVQWWRTYSDYARANHYAQRVVAIDPTNEKAHQHLIVNLIALGDRSAAYKQYKECERILRDELNVEPSLETQTLYQWLRQSEARRTSAESLLTNLPTRWLDFVGRERERAELERLVQRHRLVTLIGAGGCGKTSLAIQVASQLVNAFRDGVWWVNLATLSDEELVASTIAMALGVRESAQQTLENTLADYLRNKHLLLLLDGCDHVVDTCASLVETLLSRCAQLHILITGREALGIAGEVLWQVQPLTAPDLTWYQRANSSFPKFTPEMVADLMRFDAVQLFVKRATAVNPHFVVNEKNAFAVAEICRRLDGIPLAIELAAARTRTMSVAQIADRLGDRFRILTSGLRTALPHHQTLQGAMDWS
ncbi:MAG: NB-ARC domain-containing protein [Anaerolineae bacterium]|nr:NB-ARC domain-containing protein [Anaerolineae bacterium]